MHTAILPRRGLLLIATIMSILLLGIVPAARASVSYGGCAPLVPNQPSSCAGNAGIWATSNPSFIGWGRAGSLNASCEVNLTVPGGNCIWSTVPVWYLSKGTWRSYQLKLGDPIYVRRYSANYHWAYSSRLKYWFVVRLNHVIIGSTLACQRYCFPTPMQN